MLTRLALLAMVSAFLSGAARAQDLPAAVGSAGALLGSSPMKALAERPRGWPEVIERAEQATVLVETDQAYGSGFIVDAGGLVVTNAHVVSDAKIGAKLSLQLGGQTVEGELVASGSEDCRDIALIQLSGRSDWPVLPLSRTPLKKGMEVVALGHPGGPKDKKGDHPMTISRGVVSGLDRRYDKKECLHYVQTDASVNSGNSGGPLILADGSVAGANTWGFIDKQQMNFAISVGDLERALAQYARVKHLSEGSLGFMVGADEKRKELIVRQVMSGHTASKAGLSQGDVLASYDGKPAGDDEAAVEEFVRWVRDLVPGDTATVGISRGGKAFTLSIVVEKFAPAPPQRLAEIHDNVRRG